MCFEVNLRDRSTTMLEHQPAFGLGQDNGDAIGEAVAGN